MYRQLPQTAGRGCSWEVKGRHHSEESGTGTARGPEQVGIFVGVAIHPLAVGGDDLYADAALTCGPDRQIPTQTARRAAS